MPYITLRIHSSFSFSCSGEFPSCAKHTEHRTISHDQRSGDADSLFKRDLGPVPLAVCYDSLDFPVNIWSPVPPSRYPALREGLSSVRVRTPFPSLGFLLPKLSALPEPPPLLLSADLHEIRNTRYSMIESKKFNSDRRACFREITI